MAKIRVLGAYGGRGASQNTTSFLLSRRVAIDAGNILGPLGRKARRIDHIFLSHCHLDHIIDIPFLIDAFFAQRTEPLYIHALPKTIESIKKHILNWDIWPDFNDIDLLGQKEKSILFEPIEFDREYAVDGLVLKPIATNHTVPSCGFVVTKKGQKALLTLDTYLCDRVWEEINGDFDINTLIIEVSFPSRMEKLAEASKHLTPKLLVSEMKKIKRDTPLNIYINHLKPDFFDEITDEIAQLGLDVTVLEDGDTIDL